MWPVGNRYISRLLLVVYWLGLVATIGAVVLVLVAPVETTVDRRVLLLVMFTLFAVYTARCAIWVGLWVSPTGDGVIIRTTFRTIFVAWREIERFDAPLRLKVVMLSGRSVTMQQVANSPVLTLMRRRGYATKVAGRLNAELKERGGRSP